MKADARKIHQAQADDTDRTVLARLSALKRMSVKELKNEWQTLFGEAAPNNSRIFLEICLGHRIQELTYGGPDRETRRMLDLLADEVEGLSTRKSQTADPRNPVAGTRLVREWNGVTHTVTVLTDGFDWQGRNFKSLSATAREITGMRWNGYLYRLLNNRVYRGEAVHKGNVYGGEHYAIIDDVLWERAHAILGESPRVRGNQTRTESAALLKGLIFSETGAGCGPTNANQSPSPQPS